MNVYRDSVIPFTQFGGTSMSSEFPNFNGEENWLAIFAGEGGFTNQTSMPDGNYPPVTWKMPLTAGAMACRNRIIGTGTLTANVSSGIAIIASLTGSGTISQAVATIGIAILASISGSGGVSSAIGSLLSQITAALSGSGTISNADLKAYLNALASLIGQGDITDADLEGLGELIAALEGEGIITALLTGEGELGATITSYGSLTPEGIRDAIWSAAAANFNVAGTMGAKLNSAASGGVDYDALAEAVWDGEVSGRSGSTQAGKVLTDIKSKTNLIPGLF